LRHCW